MADLYMVTIEGKDGSFVMEPECFDDRGEASLRAGLLALRHKERFVTLYGCEAIRVYDPD